ncbi:MAG: alkaline phosphatase [Rhodobacteraceae bacterium]|nr:alkaline phosphatase [Paracoccaceae bacterium]MBR9820057.1 alkaline phosphatase [Paracoccaceae bacterium]
MPSLPRRRLLASGLAAAALWPGLAGVRAARFTHDPFTLGVASGCPTPEGVVLWTRLTFPEPPAPANPFAVVQAAPLPPMDLLWEVAEDEGFGRVVRQGVVRAVEAFAHSAHVAVTGLRPDRWYFYRFRAGEALSPTGRTRTAPAGDVDPGRFRFAFAACQQYEQGYYAALRDMAQRDPDLIVHLGDYIYEMSYGAGHVRSHGTGNPTTLREYRDRYALYKSDPDLQAAHAAAPWLVIWDDHEVINNYHGEEAPGVTDGPGFLRQRAAAYQACYEHMPVPPHAGGDFARFRIHGQHRFGTLLDITLLDSRQYRTPPQAGGAGRSYLGAEQEAWLDRSLQQSHARWSVIAQQTLLSERDLEAGSATRYSGDTWDGYRAARGRLLDSVQRAGLANPLVIGGDLHAFYAAEVKRDFAAPDAPVLATEFVTGSITSNPPSARAMATVAAENPHLKFASGGQHGYAMAELGRGQAQVDFIAVSDRRDPAATARVAQSFAVLNGRPGVNRL